MSNVVSTAPSRSIVSFGAFQSVITIRGDLIILSIPRNTRILQVMAVAPVRGDVSKIPTDPNLTVAMFEAKEPIVQLV